MEESYGEGLATHTGPESCGATCEGGIEALTGARAGWVWSRETTFLRDADAVEVSGRLLMTVRSWRLTRREFRGSSRFNAGDVAQSFAVFDCLYRKGRDLRSEPLSHRRRELEAAIDDPPTSCGSSKRTSYSILYRMYSGQSCVGQHPDQMVSL